MLAIAFGILSFFTSTDFQNQQDTTISTVTPIVVGDTVKLPNKLKVNTDTGEYFQIRRIFIIGNRVTRDRIILRELSFREGDYVHSAELPIIIDRDQKKLFNTHLFNTASVKTLDLEPGKIDIVVNVNERWYTIPEPRFSLSDRNFNEWWQNYNHDFHRVIYGLKLYQSNMRGRNETLLFKALFGFQHEFGLGYKIPYIDKKQKQGLIFNLEYIETKNLAYRTLEHKLLYLQSRSLLKTARRASVTYTYRNSFYEIHSIGAEYKSSNINDSVYILNNNYFGAGKKRQRYASLTYQFSSDHRDVFAYPLTGYQFLFSISKLGLGLGDDINKTELSITYARYIELKKKIYFSNLSNIYWSTPDKQPYSNYGALGGFQKPFVKGYEIYIIEGPYYFLNKSTLKTKLFKNIFHWSFMPRGFREIPISIYPKIYFDLGYVQNYSYYQKNDMNTLLTNKIIGGAGTGVDLFASYDVVLRLEYTYNFLGNSGFYLHIKKEF
jgi:outer membrane protein assembly factor BamA